MTRRQIIAGSLAAGVLQAQRTMWRPKVGILVNYSEGNVAFAKQEGFTSIGFWAQANGNLAHPTDAAISQMRDVVQRSGLRCSVLGVTANHTDPDPAKRKAVNDHTSSVIETAGKLGVPF